ncbi:MAG: isochorismatase [Desulfobulbaceae bacterium A2]|nr:MAG: isochorismatase [Desulfobulbaceae bacterium A2]
MKRALLVIDVQNEYFFGKLPVLYPDGSLDNILRVMDAAGAGQLPVAVIRHAAAAANSPVFRRGTPEWELHPEVDKRQRDVLIEKHWPDSFFQTNLEEWLISQSCDTLTICGYMTQMCCDTTARHGFHLGYGVEFLADATGTLDFANAAGKVSAEELHRAILVTQASRFSTVLSTQEWIARVAGGK